MSTLLERQAAGFFRAEDLADFLRDEQRDGPKWAQAFRDAQDRRDQFWEPDPKKPNLTHREATMRALYVEGRRRAATKAEKSGGCPVGWFGVSR